MRPKRIKRQTSTYIDADQDERLSTLSRETRIPVAVLIREGVDLMLRRYERHLDPARDAG